VDLVFCGECGTKLEDGVRFCPHCGARVEQIYQQYQMNNTVYQPQVKSTQKFSKTKVLLTLVAVLVVVVIGVCGAIFVKIRFLDDTDKNVVSNKKKAELSEEAGILKEELDSENDYIEKEWIDGNVQIDDQDDVQESLKTNETRIVKSITYSSDGNILSWDKYEYDSKGNNTKITTYYDDDTQGGWILKEYDRDNNLIKSVTYNQDGEISQETEYDGNITKSFTYYRGNLSQEYEYDNNSNMTNYFCYYNEDGTISYYSKAEIIERDNKGNPTKYASTSNDDIEYYYITNEYNQENKLERVTSFNKDGVITGKVEYNSNGGFKQTYYNEEGKIYQEIEYNSNGDIIKMNLYSSGELYYYEESEYNSDNSPIKDTKTYVNDESLNTWTEYIYE
jgi:hypothetical protein